LGEALQRVARPWTLVELGQRYYGSTYTPALREGVEQALQHYRPYFDRKRMGAQWLYLPVDPALVARQQDGASQYTDLGRGEVIVVQLLQGNPRIGLVLGAGTEPHAFEVVIEGWKLRQVTASHIRIVPDMQRPDLLDLEPSDLKARLAAWHQALKGEAVDQILVWHRAGGEAQSFTALAQGTATSDERLALALDLLQRGSGLWKQVDALWVPRPAAEVFARLGAFVQHHLTLAGHPGLAVQHQDGRTGTLTGRSRWSSIEVAWSGGGQMFCPGRNVAPTEAPSLPEG